MGDCSRAVDVAEVTSHVDHTHDGLDIIRGVLCMSCNVRLGWYESNRRRETAFREYLDA